jgi:hypothetical protein
MKSVETVKSKSSPRDVKGGQEPREAQKLQPRLGSAATAKPDTDIMHTIGMHSSEVTSQVPWMWTTTPVMTELDDQTEGFERRCTKICPCPVLTIMRTFLKPDNKWKLTSM